jgi:DNA-binding MarR family transcriptional regulator
MSQLSKEDYKAQAAFRHALRKFLRVSENNSRDAGVTPQQYQLLLAIKGMSNRDWATISELAKSLQILHHSTVGLCQRAEQIGLVSIKRDTDDKRQVRVYLTQHGEDILAAVATKNRNELEKLKEDIIRLFMDRSLTT